MVKLIRTRYIPQYDEASVQKILKLLGKYNLNKHKLSRSELDVIRVDVSYARRANREPFYFRYDVTYKNILFKNVTRDFVLRLLIESKTNFKHSSLLHTIKEHRAAAKQKQIVTKRLGHYVYDMVGGVIVSKERTISKVTRPYNKQNHVAIELEFVSEEIGTLNSILYSSPYYKYTEIKSDGSLRTDSRGGEPLELVICCPEDKVKEVVTDVVTRVQYVGAYVNSSCGLHVHLDARNRDASVMYSNLFKARKLLSSLVPAPRRRNKYCKMNTKSTFTEALGEGERYRAINPQAFYRHKTIEVRLHHGTINANTIINWVTLLLKIIGGTNVKKDQTVNKIVEIKKKNAELHTLENDDLIAEEAV